MRQSGKRSPCPSCGRDSDGDCRFSDQVVLCHSGKRFAPPKHLRVGDVITLQGRPWALVATGKGYDGAAHVFKPHNPRNKQKLDRSAGLRRAAAGNDLHRIDDALGAFQVAAQTVLAIPPLEQMLDHEINEARNSAIAAEQQGRELIQRLTRAKYVAPYCEVALREVEKIHRTLRYQLQDLNRYCASPGHYWASNLLSPCCLLTASECPNLESDWLFWNADDSNYHPKNPVVAELHTAWRAR